jgi:hypothetical protein
MLNALIISELCLRLAGHNVSFKVDRDEDGACLTIRSPETTLHVSMSDGQFDALDAAIRDVRDKYMVTGSWFSNRVS